MNKEELLIYNTVQNNLGDEEDFDTYVDCIQQKVSKIDAMTADIIYAFIRKYQLEESKDISVDKYKQLPYGCKLLKKGLKVDLASLPTPLLRMIYVFLTRYYADSDSDE